jgi:methionyl aminopeptidase
MGLIKTPAEQESMRQGGKILAEILKELKQMIVPSLNVWSLEERFLDYCKKNQVEPACKGYTTAELPPFPAGLCISINKEAVHCYPKQQEKLRAGDTIAVDTVIKYQGLHVDSAFTAGVGQISELDRRFLETAQMASNSAIKQAYAGNHIEDIGYIMQNIMELAGFNVLYDFVGHGIGTKMHESPDIPCFGRKGHGIELKEGMTLAIEALVCQGDPEIYYPNRRDWQTEMADGMKFAIFEHTVLIGTEQPEVLTA